MLVAGDTFRAGAIEQLNEWAITTKTDIILKENAEVKEYYLNTDNFEEIDLLKTTEINWSTDYYVATSQSFVIITLPEYSTDINQYYRADSTEFGNVIFTPINMTAEAYEPNKYYQLKSVYEKSNHYRFISIVNITTFQHLYVGS